MPESRGVLYTLKSGETRATAGRLLTCRDSGTSIMKDVGMMKMKHWIVTPAIVIGWLAVSSAWAVTGTFGFKGSGISQITFGSNDSALTAGQLAEITVNDQPATLGSDGRLYVAAAVTIDSLAGLSAYMRASDHRVTMTPGTYRITGADVDAGTFPDTCLFEFTGTNSVFDFTGVTIEVDTSVLRAFGNVVMQELFVKGEDLVLRNLTLIDVGSVKPYRSAQSVLLDGRGNRIEGFNVATRGSYPYGYGDIFGKGADYVIKHWKHSAILVRGVNNHLKDCKIFHRSYGHGIFCQGSKNATIEGCYVEGETRTSDDVLAEEGSGSAADGVDFQTVWGYPLQPGWMFSCQEGIARPMALPQPFTN